MDKQEFLNQNDNHPLAIWAGWDMELDTGLKTAISNKFRENLRRQLAVFETLSKIDWEDTETFALIKELAYERTIDQVGGL